MIKLELSLETSEDVLTDMYNWCNKKCSEPFYYFPSNIQLEESAKFWFEDELEAFLFKLTFAEQL